MTAYQWFVFFLIVQLIHGLGTWKLYEKAGRKSWEAFIPVYNSIVLMKIINRPTWWTFLLFLPVINLIMFPVIWVETLRSFGKNSTTDTILGIATFGLYIYYVNYTQNATYIKDRNTIATTKTGDTVSSLLFAIVVATFVHTYFIQPFVIPTASLEKSLLIGDFLFVSKFNYGARTPITPIAAPMVHDTLPLLKVKSYLPKPQLPYFRFPGFEKIKNNDIVVFNWPADTLYNMYKDTDVRYDKPIDKKTNYVKRCVGISGDSLQIKNGIVFVNGKELILPERAKPQYFYTIMGKNNFDESFKNDYEITESGQVFQLETKIWDNNVLQDYLIEKNVDPILILKDSINTYFTGNIDQEIYDKLNLTVPTNIFQGNLTFEKFEKMKLDLRVKSVTRYIHKGPENGIFPNFKNKPQSVVNNWSSDNFGPIYIPQEGKTITVDTKVLPFYKKIIGEYEGNDLKVVGNDIFINNKKATTYTFKQNYYFMMGDNRHNSLDARFYGYTPEDHIVGKPIFLWMSWDSNGKGFNKVRWNRVFTTVGGDGQPQSYFQYFLIALALYFGVDYFLKKRREKE